MHIAVCGPATLSVFQGSFDGPIDTKGYPFPGTSNLVMDYLARGHQVSVVTTGTDITRRKTYHNELLRIYVLPSRERVRNRAVDFFAQERRGIAATLKEIQPDVVHAHWTYEFGLAARSSPFPSLVTVHDWAPAMVRLNKHPYWYLRAAMQFVCLSRRGQVTAPSQYLAGLVSERYGRDCTVVPNGIDIARYAGQQKLDSDHLRVGMLNVGFSNLKNVQTAIRAWPAIRRAVPGAFLHLAGPGYEVNGPAWSFAKENGLEEGVIFEGPVEADRVPAWFNAKDLFLHTSLEESFGIVLCEAMASGVPVIAGRGAGAVEEVTGGAAVLTDVGSVESVSAAVVGTLRDRSAMLAMSARGKTAVAAFESSKVADQYLELLESCVRGPGTAK